MTFEDKGRGCLPRETKVGDGAFRIFGDPGIPTPKLIPPADYDKWSPTNHLKGDHWHTIDQAQQGSCCGAATVGAFMLGRKQKGLKRIVLSQASVYALGNDGQDQGMAIDSALTIMLKTGACPTSVIDQYDWQGYNRGTWPMDWREEAKRFRLLEAFDCPTFGHAMSAVFLGYPVVYGCAGHAVIMVGRKHRGEHYDLNSWGKDWGENGIGQWKSDRQTAAELPRYGAWAIRVGTDPTDDGDVPRKAEAAAAG